MIIGYKRTDISEHLVQYQTKTEISSAMYLWIRKYKKKNKVDFYEIVNMYENTELIMIKILRIVIGIREIVFFR